MEQPISPNIQPVHAAATDPAFVPGITPPPADESAEAAEATEAAEAADSAESAEPAADEAPEASATPTDDAVAEEDAEEDAGEDAPEGDDAEGDDADGPVLEAADRRGSVTADRDGIRFQLDDQEADFDWDEVGAVEYETSRFGRWFTITVHLPGPRRRWYQADVEAPSKSRIKEWTAQLDAVLDAYFEDA
ncbi:hypothetical protein OG607_35170 [Streptomyces sp. NBC_01537]|uniref:hypothetical protein n=1 Tax=Streptomyces sp. NBC_01537 TaxID=2903896 RepID=UPI00386D54C5